MRRPLLFLLLFPLIASAQKSYWQIEQAKRVIATSLFFEAFLDQFTSLDHLTYDQATGRMFYYDAYKQGLKPAPFDSIGFATAQSEWKIIPQPRIVGAQLKILIYDNNKNIAFIICKKAADNETSFLDQVKASKMLVHTNMMDAVKEQSHISLTPPAAGNEVLVNLDNYSLKLPPGKYFIAQSDAGSYAFFPRDSKGLQKDFEIRTTAHNDNDSLEEQNFWPLVKEDALLLSGQPYYNWQTNERGINAYLLSYSKAVPGGFVNIAAEENKSAQELLPLLPFFRSFSVGKKGISREAYNYPTNTIKSVEHTLEGLRFTLPVNYKIGEFSTGGNNFYAFAVLDSLVFSSDDSNSHYYPVEELNKEGSPSLKLARGGLYSLKKPGFYTDIAKIKADFIKNNVTVFDQDRTGILYEHHGSFYLLRYTRVKEVHYVYSMQFDALDGCLQEFSRSAVTFPVATGSAP